MCHVTTSWLLLYGMAELRISTTFQFYAATLIILVRLCPKDPHGTKKQWQIPLQHPRRRNTEHLSTITL